MKALLHVARKYKEECDKITEDLKFRIKTVRELMETVDLSLIESFHTVVKSKRT